MWMHSFSRNTFLFADVRFVHFLASFLMITRALKHVMPLELK